MECILISIVEDITEIREGMRFLVNQTPGFRCVSVYDNAEDAVKGLPDDAPDIVIMDIALPQETGITCIRKLKALGLTMQFMVFTVYEDSTQVFDALAAGASGYLLKNTSPEKIISALRELYEGGSPMSLSIARKVVASFQQPAEKNELSAREMEVLGLLAKGLLYKEIGEKLFISTGTVKQHIHHIYDKLHVQNRTEAINKVFGKKGL
ncbi:two component transcriptional regulator, LuxR family [Filimonas lacunae]|uniref:Two component transcriptional regulator, LuxR family n=1 Tax=Filimonas lacunae TaxID=477680 RepID=A0A173MI13_9BACT|nr:response regulator transcription factor [Filimonas lacunae]BAV07235.1 two-component system response regulator [Filimonas lacunae]SIS92813.1 two component transcriptional regulator, LuxR family [Filimonas lacunae]